MEKVYGDPSFIGYTAISVYDDRLNRKFARAA